MENVVYLWNQIVAIASKNIDLNVSPIEMEFLDYEEIAIKYGSIENLCRAINEIILQLTNQVK